MDCSPADHSPVYYRLAEMLADLRVYSRSADLLAGLVLVDLQRVGSAPVQVCCRPVPVCCLLVPVLALALEPADSGLQVSPRCYCYRS